MLFASHEDFDALRWPISLPPAGPVDFGFRTASKILAGPSGPTAVFSSPETEIDPVQWVPINDLWYKTAIQAAFGQVVLAMISVPRYRHQVLADLAHLVIDPLVRDCIAVATPKPVEAGDETEALSPAAIAIWASVSQEVELRIQRKDKRKQGVLEPDRKRVE